MAKSATVRAPDKNSYGLSKPPVPPKQSHPFPAQPRIEWVVDNNQGGAPRNSHSQLTRILRLIARLSPAERRELDLEIAQSPPESISPPFYSPLIGDIRNGEEAAAGGISVEKATRNEVPDYDEEILAQAAEHYGLDLKEAHLALGYAAASKELARRTMDASPEEATRLKGMKRLWSLSLDLCQRLKVAALLPSRLVDERQADLAGQLERTSQELRKLEKALFGSSRTPHNNLVTKANARRRVWASEKQAEQVPEPDAPTASRPTRKSPHLAA